MSDAAAAAPKKKGGKMKKLVMIGGGVLLLLGAGAGAGFYASGGGAGGGGHDAPKEDPHAPKLVLKEGATEHGAPADHPKATGHGESAEHADMSAYKATYYPIEQSFTSNLRDSDGFAQIGIGVSTYYDTKLVDAIKENEMPIRSAVLLALADQDAMVITTPEGKKRLQNELKLAINGVLKEKTGYAGVDDVYFTSFIIQ